MYGPQPMYAPGYQQMAPMSPGYSPQMMPMYAPQPPPQQMYYPSPPVTPVYMPPPPPQQQVQPIIIKTNNNGNANKTHCPICGAETGNLPRKKVGMTAIMWCLVLTSCGLCFVPLCCTDSCKDLELLCVKCQTVKVKVPANCC